MVSVCISKAALSSLENMKQDVQTAGLQHRSRVIHVDPLIRKRPSSRDRHVCYQQTHIHYHLCSASVNRIYNQSLCIVYCMALYVHTNYSVLFYLFLLLSRVKRTTGFHQTTVHIMLFHGNVRSCVK